ncbi:F5/8 type C domain containing protein [Tritrichomonas foetus]|uniref:F5/8 type C domain containing protein n=1 Tax=Tritrichomonas foetus TaxID=1144522 RepID=A0A1J4JZP1_9EUKA|nr:F5/8 type C domain containing protein [Tritrichomonas foetus]|eukprot:OHT04451.1 F5/8 type C domain containing protein [Tritrichomonas foetus]
MFLNEILFQLGNDDYCEFNQQFNESITADNVISRIKSKLHFKQKLNSSLEIIREELDFISKNFYKMMGNDELLSLGIETLEIILQNKNLKLQDEDSLFDFIGSLSQKSEKYINSTQYQTLFEYVKFEHLTQKSIQKFISIFDINLLDSCIWSSICRRLVLTPNNDENTDIPRFRKIIKIPFKGTLNEGVFHYLKQKCDGDPSDKGLVTITDSSSQQFQSYQPKNTINPLDDGENLFYSLDQPNQWICYQFNSAHFRLLKYQIQTNPWNKNFNHIKSWVLETSNDGENWEEVDRQINSQALNGPKLHAEFDIKSSLAKFVPFIRLRNIDADYAGSHYLIINSVEFYGDFTDELITV